MDSRMLGRFIAPVLGLALLLASCESEQEIPTGPDVTPVESADNSPYRISPTDMTNPDPGSWTLQREFDLSDFFPEGNLAAIGTLTPTELIDTLAAGETVTEQKTASLPAQADVVDIVFAFDNTGSMGGELDNLKTNAVDIMESLAGLISDVQFGLVSFADYDGSFENTISVGGCDYANSYGFTGDAPYVVEQTLDANIGTVATAIGDLTLSPGGGADLPESYSRALYELAQELLDNTGPDGPVNWRPEARRIVIMFGDAIPHDCDLFGPVESVITTPVYEFLQSVGFNDFGIDPGRDATIGTSDDLAILDVIGDLVDTDLTLISLHSVQTPVTGAPVQPTLALWEYYAEETGGTNFEINTDGSFPPGTDIVETILELVGEQISTVDELILDVCPGDEAFSDWISAVTPPSYTNIDLPADRDFDLVVGPPSGTEAGTYEFDVCAIGDGAVLGSQSVSIMVPGEAEPSADLSIVKTADVTTALVNDTITWTITVENAGPDEATNVVLTDVLPSGVTLLTDLSGICAIDSGIATCALGDLASGGSVEIDVLTLADEAGTPVNAVEIVSDVADPDEGDNSSSAEVTVTEPSEPTADLSVAKTADVTTAQVGDTITWTIAIENAGLDEATNVVLTDVLPSGVTLLTDLSGICTLESGVATCALGDLASGGSVEIDVLTTADEAGNPVNAVEIASDVVDPNTENNSSSAEVTVTEPGGEPTADLSIVKTSDVTTALVGDTITWTIRIENAGPDEATNVVYTDFLPSGISLVPPASPPSICTVDDGVATCEVGDLASGGSFERVLRTIANVAGTLLNAVEIASDVVDPNTGNNSSSAEVTVTEPPLPGECVVIDFENSGSHLSNVNSFALGESTITISVEPGGPRSQAATAIYDTDTVGGPDPDLEWDGGTCAGCAGQGNVVVIADIGIATGGDSEDGGVIVLTGFPGGGWGFNSLLLADSDGKPFEIYVDGVMVGASTPGVDGNVQTVGLDANTIESEVRIDLDRDSGAIDDLEFCPAGN